MANKFPKEVYEKVSTFIYENLNTNNSIAVLLSYLNGSQLSYLALKEIKGFGKNDPYTELSVYYVNKELPISTPLCATYSISELGFYRGAAISTDIQTAYLAAQNPKINNIFYVYDLLQLQGVSPEIIREIIGKGTIIIARSKEHKKALEAGLGIKISDEVVLEINLVRFKEIIKRYFGVK